MFIKFLFFFICICVFLSYVCLTEHVVCKANCVDYPYPPPIQSMKMFKIPSMCSVPFKQITENANKPNAI